MKQILKVIANNIDKADNFDLTMKINTRKIYVDSKIYEEDNMVLVFMLETENWFDQTLRFEIKINTAGPNIYYKKGYGEEFVSCEKRDYKKVINYILEEMLQFTNRINEVERNVRKIV